MATRRRRKTGKVLFVKSNPKRHRSRRRRHNPAPAVFLGNPSPRRRRHARRAVTVVHRRRRSNPAPRRHFRRHRRTNPGSFSLSFGKGLAEQGLSVLTSAAGYFGALYANKYFPASMIRYRGGILLLAALIASAKIKQKHLQTFFLGVAVEGGVDVLRQNVSTFASLSADDAAEHMILGAGSQISTNRGNSALGYSPSGLGAQATNGLGEELEGEQFFGAEQMFGAGMTPGGNF
jgi:hypothetical protein